MEQIKPNQYEADEINKQLIEQFGIDTSTNQPIWRVAWSEDQFEHRFGTYVDYTQSGIYVRTVTENRVVPKYRQWIKEKWVLERLVAIPEHQRDILLGKKVSYEPMFPFEGQGKKYLPPRYDVAKIVIDAVYAAQGKKSLSTWVEEFSCAEEEEAARDARIAKIQEYLFADETDVSDHLARKTGVIVPGPINVNG